MDHIHVRPRRGQAATSYCLAKRAWREKIRNKIKFLQELVPGRSRIRDKACMLDKIINYVQSLQRQVEFLSKKLAALSPNLEFNIGNIFVKKVRMQSLRNLPSRAIVVQKRDHIHVRAQLGQAIASHSLAERNLIPGCSRIEGKAAVLDEIINYFQSLQRQVEFLSKKLAALDPKLEFNIDNLFVKEVRMRLPYNLLSFAY